MGREKNMRLIYARANEAKNIVGTIMKKNKPKDV